MLYSLTGDQHSPPMLDGLLEDFVGKVKRLIEDVIWEGNLRGVADAGRLFDIYASLSPAAQAKFCISPEAFAALIGAVDLGASSCLATLADLCEDLRRPADPLKEITAELVERGDAGPQMLLGGTILVDLDSPHCRRIDPSSPVFFSEFEQHSQEEMACIAAKLYRAFERIEHASPSFARLIRNYTRTIYIRRSGTLPPSSEQVDTRLGAIGLRNIHQESYTDLQLTDDLIHESVHNFLGTHEFLAFPFMTFGGRRDDDARPVSPWSSRPIRLTPFIHAVFVYFALLSFARLRLREPELAPADRVIYQRRRNRYVSGFLMPGRLTEYIRGFGDVDPRVLGMIDAVQDIVINNYREDCAEHANSSRVAELLDA